MHIYKYYIIPFIYVELSLIINIFQIIVQPSDDMIMFLPNITM